MGIVILLTLTFASLTRTSKTWSAFAFNALSCIDLTDFILSARVLTSGLRIRVFDGESIAGNALNNVCVNGVDLIKRILFKIIVIFQTWHSVVVNVVFGRSGGPLWKLYERSDSSN